MPSGSGPGWSWVRQVSRIAGRPEAEVAAVASLVTASVTYLVMLEEFCPVYNGIAIDTNGGWEQIAQGIDRLIDPVFRGIVSFFVCNVTDK